MGLQDMKCFLAFIISLWIPVRIEDSLSSLQGSNQSKRRGQEIASLNIQRVSFINGPDECFTTCKFWKSLVYLEWIGLHGFEELWKYGMLDTLNNK